MLQGGVKPACSKGFTLAEVLITLAIVGVVAALTIPSLINKCQKIVWAKQAQETHAILTQAFKRILADNNTTSLSQTEVWSKVDYTITHNSNNLASSNKDFFTELGKYIKISPSTENIVKNYKHSEKSNDTKGSGYPINLPNGAQIYNYFFYKKPTQKTDEVCKNIKALGGNMCNYIGWIYIDINGDKGPNTYGRDCFQFPLSDEGVLYPYGGKDYALHYNQTDLATNASYWKNYYNGTKEQIAKKNQYYRIGQLVEEGWKMNY
jgi:prepilin-type N-terminal cleavage/methylation domain-containing protein